MTTPTNANITCPVCGSSNVSKRTEKRKIGDHLTGTEFIEEFVYKCSACGEEGDFAKQNDSIYDEAIRNFSPKAMNHMLNALNEKGITLAHFERCLDLPQRTTARWKREGASAAATALVKIIITYPWLLNVAEKNFETDTANNVLMQEGIKGLNTVVDIFRRKADVTTLINNYSGNEKPISYAVWAAVGMQMAGTPLIVDQNCSFELDDDLFNNGALRCHLVGRFQPQL